MKNRFLSILVSVALGWLAGCKEPTIDEGILPFTEAATTDATGGSWRTIILKAATDVSVPQPTASTSTAYQAELTAVKNGLLSIGPEQNTAVTYWAEGGVLRWNQIARLLVSKYNVAPAYDNATGLFAPFDAAKPYAGSPFAARVYALLSVAQYDALVVAWRAKYQYNRPSLDDQGVVARVPVLNVPSYPSEDAAIAEASCQMLAYFFPNEAAWLKVKAAEHKQSRVWAGANVPSDVKAGEDLAATVVAKVLTRAKSDRFATAHDPNNTWLTTLAKAPYDQKWKSLEIPARSPLFPLAGKVKTWFDSTTIFRGLPTAPPATTSATFQKAVTEVRDIANARTREQWRIADYWSDGAGTYTLPGHWNFIAEGLVQEGRQNELRAARTYALMNRAIQDGATACWSTKYTYFVPRPSQVDPSIRTATIIPNSPAYPSEQATFSTAAATVLSYLFPDEAVHVNAQAAEATLSQLYGGTQYRFDTEAGAQSGAAIGKLATDWAKADGAK